MKEKQKKPNYLKFGENKCGGMHLVFILFAILTDFKPVSIMYCYLLHL